MKTIRTHFDAQHLKTIREAPGRNDAEKVRWIVDLFGAILARRELDKATLQSVADSQEQAGDAAIVAARKRIEDQAELKKITNEAYGLIG